MSQDHAREPSLTLEGLWVQTVGAGARRLRNTRPLRPWCGKWPMRRARRSSAGLMACGT